MVPPSFLNSSVKVPTRPCPYAFLSWIVATLVIFAVSYRYRAANGPWTASVVQVRKYVGYGRFGSVCQFAPWVRPGPVLAGETWTIFAAARTGWTCWLTLVFSVPTTPITSLSLDSAVAAFLPGS